MVKKGSVARTDYVSALKSLASSRAKSDEWFPDVKNEEPLRQVWELRLATGDALPFRQE